jgi:hypothetical protein
MTETRTAPAWILFAVVAAVMITIEAMVSARLVTADRPTLVVAAITVDLVVGLPALAWLLVVRRGAAPGAVVPMLAVGGLLVALALVPAPHDAPIAAATRLLPLLEAAAIAYALTRVHRMVRHYRTLRPAAVYGVDALQEATAQAFGVSPRVAAVMTSDLTPLALAVLGWRRDYVPPHGAAAFTSHRAGGYGGMLAMLGLAMTVETVGLHVLVSRWQPAVAWVLTTLSVFTMVWLLGDYHGLRLNPHVLDAQTLRVRVGLRWRTDLPRTAIREVRRYRETRDGDALALAPLGEPALVIELDRPVTVDGMFGMRREADVLAIAVDDATALQAALTRRPSG